MHYTGVSLKKKNPEPATKETSKQKTKAKKKTTNPAPLKSKTTENQGSLCSNSVFPSTTFTWVEVYPGALHFSNKVLFSSCW